MKILYGVQGTGNGHLSRARSMCKHLSNGPFEVDYLFSGRQREDYFDMDAFGNWDCRRGLTFSTNKGKIQILSTLRNVAAKTLINDIKSVRTDDYDLIISDYEPIVAWAAHRAKRDCLGIGHQYAFNHNIPIKGDNIATRLIMNKFAPTTHGLGLHWYHFNAPILPPIVDTLDHVAIQPSDDIIVYLPFEDPDSVCKLLKQVTTKRFQYFGHFKDTRIDQNIVCNPISREKFQKELHNCSGVISNAGFELASEAINLGKKILVKPLHGQMEQISNALAIQELGLGRAVNKLTPSVIEDWLHHQQAAKVDYPDVAQHIVEWLQTGNLQNQNDLIADLWNKTHSNGLSTFKPYQLAA